MGIEKTSPKIAALRMEVEKEYGKTPKVHNDFVELAEAIKSKLHQHISETTLERVWNYSTRGYETVSLHIINLLCRYAGKKDWQEFCNSLVEYGLIDSDMFDEESISSAELIPGDLLQIGWLPDRLCVIEYLGNNRFMAIICENSTMKPGDSFCCLEFMKNQPAIMDNFIKSGKESDSNLRYVAGKVNGITTLKKL